MFMIIIIIIIIIASGGARLHARARAGARSHVRAKLCEHACRVWCVPSDHPVPDCYTAPSICNTSQVALDAEHVWGHGLDLRSAHKLSEVVVLHVESSNKTCCRMRTRVYVLRYFLEGRGRCGKRRVPPHGSVRPVCCSARTTRRLSSLRAKPASI